VKRLVRVLLRVGFYLTPVLYSLNAVHSRFGDYTALAKLNPIAGSMSLFRAGLWSSDLFAWYFYAAQVVITLLTLALGFWVFKRLEGTVLKEL
jgi:ABC-2 type transport system permease protein